MQSQLSALNQTIMQNPPSYVQHKTLYGSELLSADGNLGSRLLAPDTMSGVIIELNAFKAMGMKEVTVAIRYPLLIPTFPNSSRYLAFYENVSQQIHSRGMVMDVECAPAIPGYGLNYSFSGLNFSTLVSGEKQMVWILANYIHPDYINIDSEPATAAQVTGIRYLDTVNGWNDYTYQIFSNLSKGNTKVGIGVDSWESPDFIKTALNTSNVDFISTHVYPTGAPIPSNLVKIGMLAQQYGKPIVVDEIGPWKTTNVTEPYDDINKYYEQVDIYGFWAPIDSQFFSIMGTYAKEYNVQIMSVFPGARSLFAYVNYTQSTANLNYQQATSLINRQVAIAMAYGQITQAGATYIQIIKSP